MPAIDTVGGGVFLSDGAWRKVEPDLEDAERFCWHVGSLVASQYDSYVLEYPAVAPVDLSLGMPEHVLKGELFVLAPYFSAIIVDRATNESQYFVLGQAPLGGGTTFRCVTAEGGELQPGAGA